MTPPTRLEVDQLFRSAPHLPLDLQGWHSDQPIFEEVIAGLQPNLIIEVGTWKGASAFHMLKMCAKHKVDGVRMICIDFFHTTEIMGLPSSYELFLSNMRQCGVDDRITPLKGHSLEAAAMLAQENVRADLIYLDGGHDEDTVLADLRAYWPLLRSGGVMLGDDLHEIPTVKSALKKSGLPWTDVGDNFHWRTNKPL